MIKIREEYKFDMMKHIFLHSTEPYKFVIYCANDDEVEKIKKYI